MGGKAKKEPKEKAKKKKPKKKKDSGSDSDSSSSEPEPVAATVDNKAWEDANRMTTFKIDALTTLTAKQTAKAKEKNKAF
jgi:hypothetical protein